MGGQYGSFYFAVAAGRSYLRNHFACAFLALIVPHPQKTSTPSVSAFFSRVAQWTSRQCGRPLTFALAVVVIVVWAASGPVFDYSDTWQLVINTGTTIITFLMVFLIQNSQNRDSAAVQLKLAELIRVTEAARNRLLTLEDSTEDELERLKEGFATAAAGSETGVGMLREVSEELEEAGREIDRAQEHITTIQEKHGINAASAIRAGNCPS